MLVRDSEAEDLIDAEVAEEEMAELLEDAPSQAKAVVSVESAERSMVYVQLPAQAASDGLEDFQVDALNLAQVQRIDARNTAVDVLTLATKAAREPEVLFLKVALSQVLVVKFAQERTEAEETDAQAAIDSLEIYQEVATNPLRVVVDEDTAEDSVFLDQISAQVADDMAEDLLEVALNLTPTRVAVANAEKCVVEDQTAALMAARELMEYYLEVALKQVKEVEMAKYAKK